MSFFKEENSRYRLEPFDAEEIKMIINNEVRTAYELIVKKVEPFVAEVDTKYHKRTATMTINELGRWFYMTTHVNKVNCVLISIYCDVNFGEGRAKNKRLIAEQMIDYREGETINVQQILNLFDDIFPRRFKLYEEVFKKQQKINDLESKISFQKRLLEVEKIRAEYIALRKRNDKDMEDLGVTIISRIFEKLYF